ncbi:L-asparaginase [Staphylococcus aureus]|nr:L-asparaginase [Staphylococcus aureus]
MKHLLVIHTGGTISMSQDQSNKVVTNDTTLFQCIKMS